MVMKVVELLGAAAGSVIIGLALAGLFLAAMAAA